MAKMTFFGQPFSPTLSTKFAQKLKNHSKTEQFLYFWNEFRVKNISPDNVCYYFKYVIITQSRQGLNIGKKLCHVYFSRLHL